MFGIIDLTTFVIGTLIIVLMPGPNSLYVMSVAAKRGIKAGFAGAAGVALGDLLLMIASVAGVASLINTEPLLFMALKYAGAGYLIWLGLGLVRSAFQKESEIKLQAEVPKDRSHPFKVALMVSLLNPKAILFFVAFFIQFVDPNYDNPMLSFAILGLIVEFFSQIYLASIILIAVYFKALLNSKRGLAKWSKLGAGSAFLGFGAKIAMLS